MGRLLLILLVIIPLCQAIGQKLLVEDSKGRQKKIAIGRIVTVSAATDSLNAQPFHYTDPSDTSMSWCSRGCYSLHAIDTISNSIQIQRIDGIILDYRIADVGSVWFVRSKHPKRLKAARISLAVIGSVWLGQAIATSLSEDTKPGYYALGAVLLGYSLLDKRNEPKKYKLLGVVDN
ncbi:MAG TPA: hypothetical protein VGK59_15435 [Ohtaekwangia sp.]